MVHPGSVVKNIVLVHGAFADGSCWSRIIPLLEDKGYSVVAVQNPLTSLADDASATRRTVALQDGPVILVGHSRTSPLGVPALGRCCDYPGGR